MQGAKCKVDEDCFSTCRSLVPFSFLLTPSRLRADFDHKPISQFLPTTNVIAVYVAHDQPIVDEAET